MQPPERLSRHSDEERRLSCLAKGVDPEQHCCLDIASFISEPVEVEHQGPNPVMLWIDSWNEYRINIPLTGYQSVLARHCPWCGSRLGESLRSRWYADLHELGFLDPGEEEIPSEYESAEWWRRRGLGPRSPSEPRSPSAE